MNVRIACLPLLFIVGFAPLASADPIASHQAQEVQVYKGRDLEAEAKAEKRRSGGPIETHRASKSGAARPSGTLSAYHGSSTPHVFTQEERAQMLRNDAAAGRTHAAMSKGRGVGKKAPASGYNPCAPNCGYDYNTGQNASTIYNPNTNYSPYGH